MNKERLELLADYLEKLPPEAEDWEFNSTVYRINYPSLDCGFAGCAVYHMTKVFPEDFHVIKTDSEIDQVDVASKLYPELTTWRAVREFFEVNHVECQVLFDLRGYRSGWLSNTVVDWPSHSFVWDNFIHAIVKKDHITTPQHVAQQIRKFVAWKEADPNRVIIHQAL